MKVSVYVGDICKAPAEVVCTSTNPHLELMLGTGGAIREAGGWEIQEQCREFIRRQRESDGKTFLEPGSIAPTTAGKLPFRAVIHCVAIDAFHDSTEEIIRQCTRNALAAAVAMSPSARSIAFPVFASGNGRFDFESSLRTMADEIASSEAPLPERIVFVTLEQYHEKPARSMLREFFASCD